MRTPSRKMLPGKTPSRSAQGAVWAVVGGALLGFLWFADFWSVLLLSGFLGAVWLFGTASVKKDRRRLVGIAEGREGESICQFARSFNIRAVDTWVIRAVYEVLQKQLEFAQSGFPVRASDELEALLVDPDALDMAVAPEVGRRAGRSLENTETNPYHGKVRSVADLVMFFNAQPKTKAAPL